MVRNLANAPASVNESRLGGIESGQALLKPTKVSGW